MSISSILSSLETQVASVLGSDWSELDYVYDIEKNTSANNHNRYGIGVLNGSSVSGTNKAITVDFGFFVVLTKYVVNQSSDENERTALEAIYDEFENINKNVFQKKLNNANILLVSELSYDTPEPVGDNTISVRVNFTIKYRNQTV